MKREEKSMRTNIVKITNLNQNPHHTIQTFFFHEHHNKDIEEIRILCYSEEVQKI